MNGGCAWLLVACCLSLSSGCSGLKPAARDARGVATDLCHLFFMSGGGKPVSRDVAEKMGMSVTEAAREVCKMNDVLDPFIDQILAAKREAGEKAAPYAAKRAQ